MRKPGILLKDGVTEKRVPADWGAGSAKISAPYGHEATASRPEFPIQLIASDADESEFECPKRKITT
jgi:hypothetical protein